MGDVGDWSLTHNKAQERNAQQKERKAKERKRTHVHYELY